MKPPLVILGIFLVSVSVTSSIASSPVTCSSAGTACESHMDHNLWATSGVSRPCRNAKISSSVNTSPIMLTTASPWSMCVSCFPVVLRPGTVRPAWRRPGDVTRGQLAGGFTRHWNLYWMSSAMHSERGLSGSSEYFLLCSQRSQNPSSHVGIVSVASLTVPTQPNTLSSLKECHRGQKLSKNLCQKMSQKLSQYHF